LSNYEEKLARKLAKKEAKNKHYRSKMTIATKPQIKLNPIEKLKAEKDGLAVKDELEHFAKIGWEAVDKKDLEQRLKWLGIFYRPVTPGKFMLRLRVPNGCLNTKQMRCLAEIIQRYGEDGSADVTTRQNIQLRGVRLEDIPEIFRKLKAVGLTSIQSGMDNVRNITGSPVAGIDAEELIDTRELCQKLQDRITNYGEGNYAFTNLPRKFNIAVEGGRDNSVHSEINDIAFVPAYKDGELGFNVVVGGYLSAQRCALAVPLNAWVPANDDVVELSCAILTVYTENGLAEGLRSSRPKARLMWLIDKWGINKFRAKVEQEFGKPLLPAAEKDEITQDKKDYVGVHPQKQEGFSYVGLHIPVGRLSAETMFELARLAEVYGNGEIRATVEQNVIIPYIANENIEAFLGEPLLEKFAIAPSTLTRSLISCTGNRYCNFALVETKGRGLKIARQLDEELEIPDRVRIHWTGCPNSCGQAQMGDIGLIGTKVRKDGQTVEGVDLYMGGKVGFEAELGELVQKGVPCEELLPILRQLLIDNFGAKPKSE
jgi:ferredoxin-nitrite reductase